MIATLIGSTGLTGSLLLPQLLADPAITIQPALLVGPRQEFRLAEKVVARTLVPLVQLLPARAAKRLVTQADTLARRMLAEGKAAAMGDHVIAAKDI